MHIDENQIRAALVERRKGKQWTQEQLAAAVGTGRSTIAKIEGGDVELRFEWLNRLAYALDLPMTLIVGDKAVSDTADFEICRHAIEFALRRFSSSWSADASDGAPSEIATQCARAIRWCRRHGISDQLVIRDKVAEYLEP